MLTLYFSHALYNLHSFYILIMGPKRKKTTITHSAKKDSTWSYSSQFGKTTNNANSSCGPKRHKLSADNMAQIYYDMLTEAIIRKKPLPLPFLNFTLY